MEQVEEGIPFNYFLLKFNQLIYEKADKKLEDDFYVLSDKEQLQIFNDSFFEILVNYLVLTENNEIVVRPENPVDLCRLILSNLKDSPYKQSLLMSLQFIVARYLVLLGKGFPNPMHNDEEGKEKSFKIIYDSKERMNAFDSINMPLEEQTETMVQVLKLVMDNQEIDLPNVEKIVRTDI